MGMRNWVKGILVGGLLLTATGLWYGNYVDWEGNKDEREFKYFVELIEEEIKARNKFFLKPSEENERNYLAASHLLREYDVGKIEEIDLVDTESATREMEKRGYVYIMAESEYYACGIHCVEKIWGKIESTENLVSEAWGGKKYGRLIKFNSESNLEQTTFWYEANNTVYMNLLGVKLELVVLYEELRDLLKEKKEFKERNLREKMVFQSYIHLVNRVKRRNPQAPVGISEDYFKVFEEMREKQFRYHELEHRGGEGGIEEEVKAILTEIAYAPDTYQIYLLVKAEEGGGGAAKVAKIIFGLFEEEGYPREKLDDFFYRAKAPGEGEKKLSDLARKVYEKYSKRF